MIQSLRQTAIRFSTNLILVADHDDPTLRDYVIMPGMSLAAGTYPLWPADRVSLMVLEEGETGNLTKATNSAAQRVWNDDVVIGHVGDDHVFRTRGWDAIFADALDAQPGVIYGNDLNVRQLVPTAAFMSSIIPRTLGWMALPTTEHLYIDTTWKIIGEQLGALTYRDDIVIEHMHPTVGKAEWDESYLKSNDQRTWTADSAAHQAWIDNQMAEDIERVRGAIRGAEATA